MSIALYHFHVTQIKRSAGQSAIASAAYRSGEKLHKERNHRIFLFGGFMESIVPELKTMTEDEGKDFLYHIAKSSEAQEYLKKRAEGVEAR